jgi:GntR family transcriptional regulator/MocR family aminotransferase
MEKDEPIDRGATRIGLELSSAHLTPIRQQIFERLRALITNGQLRGGERLPSLRSLSSELGVARGTVESAYARLIGEGYLEARGPSGTYVANGAYVPQAHAIDEVPQEDEPFRAPANAEGKLQLGLPAFDAFPRKTWSRLVARRVRSLSALARPAPCGFEPLREAIAQYLHRARGIACAPEQVIVVPGYAAALALVAQTLLTIGDTAWTESPGYPPTASVLQHCGIRRVPVPVDAHGMRIEEGVAMNSAAKLAVVTPSHQSPLGVSLSLQRRLALLAWAEACGGWIVEDDYDGEFRYRGHPLPALKSLDAADRVLHVGTFSKVLFPGLRVAYVVVPKGQIGRFEAVCRQGLHGGCPELHQAAITDFMVGGDFSRHVKRMRTLYAARRGYLAGALSALAGPQFQVHLADGGMHLLASTAGIASDVDLVRRAAARGFAIQALSAWYANGPGRQGLLLGFTNVASATQANGLVEELLAAVRDGPAA